MSTSLLSALSYADAMSKELTVAHAFASKRKPELQWDVDHHMQESRVMLESLAYHLGYRIEKIAEPVKTEEAA